MQSKIKDIDKKESLQKWIHGYNFLPEILNQHSKQKEIFILFHDLNIDATKKDDFLTNRINYRQAMIYTIDIFLWVLAGYGYTLQRSRKRFNFMEIYEDLHAVFFTRKSREEYIQSLDLIYKRAYDDRINKAMNGDDNFHLPSFMRDFHDQKTLFSYIHQLINKDGKQDHILDQVSWIDAHIYVTDYFLKEMFRYGFSLQKSRAKQEFSDIQDDLAEFRRNRHNAFAKMLEGGK